jgi:uncharacterized protein YndB with AHSA1/START domain
MNTIAETKIEVDPNVPIFRTTREFAGTPEQLFRAHTDPKLFAQWIGPSSLETRIAEWDARSGGSWRFVPTRGGEEYAFRGCFHEVRTDRIVQTFTYEGDPTVWPWRRCGSRTSATAAPGCVRSLLWTGATDQGVTSRCPAGCSTYPAAATTNGTTVHPRPATSTTNCTRHRRRSAQQGGAEHARCAGACAAP